MKKVAVLVEGKGDVEAIPSLIAKTGAAFGIQIVASNPPIKSGEARKLKRHGELERYIRLGASREDVQEIVLIVDLDDGCPKDYYEEFANRAAPIVEETGKPVHICFLVREYEVLFLADIAGIGIAMPELGISPDCLIENPHLVRGAKEMFRGICSKRGYKQSRDQLIITKKLNVISLAIKNRSFRKLVKSITGKNYEEIKSYCQATQAANSQENLAQIVS